MKKISLFLVLSLLAATSARANPFDEFTQRIEQGIIKPFALDLGGLLGATGWAPARPLGFPGFSVRAVAVVQSEPDKDNMVLRDAGVTTFGLPVIEAGVGLPWNLDVVVHGLRVYSLTVVGGGLRWTAFKSGLETKFIPSVSVSGFGDIANFAAFRAEHLGLNAMATWDLPFVAPYVGAGYDATNVKVQTATIPGVSGLSATASGSRFILGLELKPPFVRINGSMAWLHGIPSYIGSLGFEF